MVVVLMDDYHYKQANLSCSIIQASVRTCLHMHMKSASLVFSLYVYARA